MNFTELAKKVIEENDMMGDVQRQQMGIDTYVQPQATTMDHYLKNNDMKKNESDPKFEKYPVSHITDISGDIFNGLTNIITHLTTARDGGGDYNKEKIDQIIKHYKKMQKNLVALHRSIYKI